jgi:hypothetical protein
MDKQNCQLLQKYKLKRIFLEMDKVLKILDLIMCSNKKVIKVMYTIL